MGREGYKSLTVKDELHAKLKQLADESHRTIPGIIEYLIEVHAKYLKLVNLATIEVTN